MVEPFIGQAGGHGAVSDNADDLVPLFFQIFGAGDAQTGGNRRAAVSGGKRIAGALRCARKSGYPAMLPERRKALAPSGQYLVCIGLVADVPDDFVFWNVKHVVKRYGQLYDSQVGSQVPAGFGDHVNDQLPDFQCKVVELGAGSFFRSSGECMSSSNAIWFTFFFPGHIVQSHEAALPCRRKSKVRPVQGPPVWQHMFWIHQVP